jgi:hypothetical protein
MDANATSFTPSDQERANFRRFVMDIVWFGLAIPSTARFLSVYAIRLDASAMLLGWLSALPAILCLSTSGLAVWWRKKYPDTVHAQFWPGVGYRLLFLLPVLTPYFPEDWQPYWLLLSVSLPALPQGISSVLFLVLMREGIDRSRLTSLVSRRSMSFNMAVAVGTLGFGFWLEEVSFPINYQIMYLLAFGLSMLSLLNVNRVRAIQPEPVAEPTRKPVRVWGTLAFQRVAFLTISSHVAFFLIAAIVPLRLVDEMGADEGFMSIFTVAELASAALVATMTNRIVRQIGTRATVSTGMIGTGVAAILLAVAPNLSFTLIAGALSGASWTMVTISLFSFFNESTPPEYITPFSTVYNQIVMLSVFVGPLLGSQLASTSLSLTTVLLIVAGLRFLAGSLAPYDLVGRMRQRQPQPVNEAAE